MRRGVISRPWETETKRICIRLRNRLVQLLLQICQQSRLVGFETCSTRIPRQRQGTIKIKVRNAGHIIEIERVRSVVWSGDVGVRPVCGLLQIIRSRVRSWGAAAAAALQGKIKLCSTEFHIIAPLGFRIEAKGNDGQEISTRRGICKVKYVLSRKQTLVRVYGITGLILVIAKSEDSGHATSQVRADQRAGLNLP